MARTVRNTKTDSRSARARIARRAEPYWTVISEGCALGYRRGSKGGSWPAIAERLGNYPELGRRAAAAIPQARLIAFPELGHSPQVEAPERFHQALLEAFSGAH